MVVVHPVVETQSYETRGRPVPVCELREFSDRYESEACVEQESDLGSEGGRMDAQECGVRLHRRRRHPVIAQDRGVARAERGRNAAISSAAQPIGARFSQGAAVEAMSE
jgi:hypothetical protein